MQRWPIRFQPWPVLVAMALCVSAQPVCGAAPPPSFTTVLGDAESLRTSDHPRFLQLLDMLHQQESGMSAHERWQLRYLDGWQAAFRGDYTNADAILRDVIEHSGDSVLATKASAVLMNDMSSKKHYEPAFDLANRLAAHLPDTQDKLARFMVLSYLSQSFRMAGQYDLAADYARQMMQDLPPGETSCQPRTMLISVLYDSHKLASSSTQLQQGIDACQAARQPIFAETIWLVNVDLYLDEDQPAKAMALLNRITPGIRANQNHYHTQSAQVALAEAYWKLGDDNRARTAALAALSSSSLGEVNEKLRNAYDLLYRIAKKHGHLALALNYYEHFAAQDIGYLNDVSARALAYDVARQRMLAQKLETEKLSRQNNTLRLQQALADKTIETGRLSIILLLMVLASVIYWLFRLKRSQLHFKQQACLDGLTGIYNHQHFIGEAQRQVRLMERKLGSACLIFIDLDFFKQINDTHGHAIGDSVLKHTVALCKQPLRASDLFGRLGGEEFAILLLDCSPAQGAIIADRIRTTIEASPIDTGDCAITYSASIGLASTVTSGYDLQRLCRDADAALYRAKRIGRNCVIAHAGHDDQAGNLDVGNVEAMS